MRNTSWDAHSSVCKFPLSSFVFSPVLHHLHAHMHTHNAHTPPVVSDVLSIFGLISSERKFSALPCGRVVVLVMLTLAMDQQPHVLYPQDLQTTSLFLLCPQFTFWGTWCH